MREVARKAMQNAPLHNGSLATAIAEMDQDFGRAVGQGGQAAGCTGAKEHDDVLSLRLPGVFMA